MARGGGNAPTNITWIICLILYIVALAARPADNLLLFARYQEGFRPGGLAVSGDIIQRFRGDFEAK